MRKLVTSRVKQWAAYIKSHRGRWGPHVIVSNATCRRAQRLGNKSSNRGLHPKDGRAEPNEVESS